MSTTLQFSNSNSKLSKLEEIYRTHVYSFSLPSGYSCPAAKDCFSKAVKLPSGKMKIKDGKGIKFRCFSASQEVLYPTVFKARQENFRIAKSLLKSGKFVDTFVEQFPKKCGIFRWFIGGDWFNQKLFDAGIEIARLLPNVRFYFYTKNLPLWVNRIAIVGNGFKPGDLPNFIPTASRGGKYDDMISRYGLRESVVVYSEGEAARLSLEIDHDDSHASKYGDSFALLIHAAQPANSEASAALQQLKILKRS